MKLLALLRVYGLACILCAIPILLGGCKGFAINFTGGRLDPSLYQKITIRNFFSDIPDGPANLGINFTEEIRDYYQRNTPLELVQSGAEVEMEGSITGYTVTPVSPSGGDQFQGAQKQRLTITVKVNYVDYVDDKNTFSTPFSFFLDFEADENLSDVEDELIPEIFDQIIFDIFNKTYANW